MIDREYFLFRYTTQRIGSIYNVQCILHEYSIIEFIYLEFGIYSFLVILWSRF